MTTDHFVLAVSAFNAAPPAHTVEGALGYVTRLLNILPLDEAAGYLAKPAGDNIAKLPDGTLVSVGRICYPDGQIYKVMTDVPNGGPSWAAEDPVDPSRYVPASRGVASPPVPIGTPPVLAPAALTLEQAVAAINAHTDAGIEKVQQQIDQIVKNAEKSAKELIPLLTAGQSGGIVAAIAGLFGKKP